MEHQLITAIWGVITIVWAGGLTAFGIFLNRLRKALNLLYAYPPHLHDNGHIIYAPGFDPPTVRSISPKANGASVGSE